MGRLPGLGGAECSSDQSGSDGSIAGDAQKIKAASTFVGVTATPAGVRDVGGRGPHAASGQGRLTQDYGTGTWRAAKDLAASMHKAWAIIMAALQTAAAWAPESRNRMVTWTPSSSREVAIVPGARAASRSILALRGRISATNPRTPRLIAYS